MFRGQLILPILLLLTLTGCFNSSLMLKTPANFEYTPLPSSISPEYRISPNDLIEFRLYTNDGFQLVNSSSTIGGGSEGSSSRNMSGQFNYKVEFDGKIKLPIIGRINIEGYTQREAEFHLEQLYSDYFIKPFLLLNITNKRIFIFPGEPGRAQVFALQNNSTTLFEAITQIGGISQNAKSNRIKLIRGSLTNPEVFLFDLSTLEGAKNSDFILQANDIIYIEPRPLYVKNIINEISPYLGLFSSIAILISLGGRLVN